MQLSMRLVVFRVVFLAQTFQIDRSGYKGNGLKFESHPQSDFNINPPKTWLDKNYFCNSFVFGFITKTEILKKKLEVNVLDLILFSPILKVICFNSNPFEPLSNPFVYPLVLCQYGYHHFSFCDLV